MNRNKAIFVFVFGNNKKKLCCWKDCVVVFPIINYSEVRCYYLVKRCLCYNAGLHAVSQLRRMTWELYKDKWGGLWNLFIENLF